MFQRFSFGYIKDVPLNDDVLTRGFIVGMHLYECIMQIGGGLIGKV